MTRNGVQAMAAGERAGRLAGGFDEQLRDSGFVEFLAAGASAAGEFRCADCGYGVVVQRELPCCPMCACSVWEPCGRGLLSPRPDRPLH